MSALGQKQTCAVQNGMCALPSKAEIGWRHSDVRFVPIADIEMLLSLSRGQGTLAAHLPHKLTDEERGQDQRAITGHKSTPIKPAKPR
jgi:hypothetical protein